MMKSALFARTLGVITALLFSIVTCYGQEAPSDQLVGTWTKSFDEGSVTFTISSDLKWEVEFTGDDVIDVNGSCEISGTQITFTDEGGDYSSDESGVYEFKAGDASLTFTKVDDPVDGRSMLLAGSWSKATGVEK